MSAPHNQAEQVILPVWVYESNAIQAYELQPASTSKCHEALGVPLILEQILINVDKETLLLSAARVSKAFRAFVYDTPSLQRKLFLRSGQIAAGSHPVFNPFLIDRYIDDLPGSSAIDLPTLYNIDNAEPPARVPSVNFYFHSLTFEQLSGAGGSWRQMLIAQAAESYALDVTTRGQTMLDEGWFVLDVVENFIVEPNTTLGSLLDRWVAGFASWASRRRAMFYGKPVPSRRCESRGDV